MHFAAEWFVTQASRLAPLVYGHIDRQVGPYGSQEYTLIVLGIILILVGYLLPVPAIIATIGWILLAIGLVLLVLGQVGRPVGGRRYWY